MRSGPSVDERPRWIGWIRPLAALLLLLILAAPSWAATLDDVYITLVYARNFAEHGVIAWTTGERVEGYSNFLFMSLLAAAIRLGLDGDVVAKVVAWFSAAGVVLLLERRLPRTAAGALVLVAVVSWTPVAHWATIGMETTFYTLLLAGGWLFVGEVEGWGVGVALLAASSITRPEGLLHLLVAFPFGLRPSRSRRPHGLGFMALVGLLAYHALRFVWFGHLLPTSYLVKVAAVGFSGGRVAQLCADLATGSGIAAALLLAGRVEPRRLPLVVLPLLLQGATLVRAGGDWMTWGRIIAPGLLASTVLYTSHCVWRARVPRLGAGLAAVAVVCASLLTSRGNGAWELRELDWTALGRPLAGLGHGLDTPLAEDVAWAIENVPSGARILTVDAGILGDVPGVQVIDGRGLSHRGLAEAIAAGTGESYLREGFRDPARRPDLLRLANWAGTDHPEYPPWLLAGYALRADLRYGGGSIRWYGADSRRPTAVERSERWAEMLRRHPSHPFLWWHAALSAMDQGDAGLGLLDVSTAAARWPARAELADAPASLSFTTGTAPLIWEAHRGFELKGGQELGSRLLAAGEAARLDVESEGATLELVLSDPCEPTPRSLATAASTQLRACAFARSIRVSSSSARVAFLRLVVTEERAE